MPKKRVKKRVPAEKPVKQNKGRWVKGQSGNPNGRPRRGETLTEILREHVGGDETLNGKTQARKVHIAEIACTAILKGYRLVNGKKVLLNDATWAVMLKWLYERVDGKPTENLSISTPEAELSSEDYKEAMKELAEWKRHREKKPGN